MAKLHIDLLDQAKMLAKHDPHPPKQASLRRAVSAAYYALFNAICDEWSRMFKPEVRPSAARMLNHGEAERAAKRLAGGGRRLEWMKGMPPCPAELQQVAEDFVELQLKRHVADYNTHYTFLRRDVTRAIDRADRSIVHIEECRTACQTELQAFLLALQGARKIS